MKLVRLLVILVALGALCALAMEDGSEAGPKDGSEAPKDGSEAPKDGSEAGTEDGSEAGRADLKKAGRSNKGKSKLDAYKARMAQQYPSQVFFNKTNPSPRTATVFPDRTEQENATFEADLQQKWKNCTSQKYPPPSPQIHVTTSMLDKKNQIHDGLSAFKQHSMYECYELADYFANLMIVSHKNYNDDDTRGHRLVTENRCVFSLGTEARSNHHEVVILSPWQLIETPVEAYKVMRVHKDNLVEAPYSVKLFHALKSTINEDYFGDIIAWLNATTLSVKKTRGKYELVKNTGVLAHINLNQCGIKKTVNNKFTVYVHGTIHLKSYALSEEPEIEEFPSTVNADINMTHIVSVNPSGFRFECIKSVTSQLRDCCADQDVEFEEALVENFRTIHEKAKALKDLIIKSTGGMASRETLNDVYDKTVMRDISTMDLPEDVKNAISTEFGTIFNITVVQGYSPMPSLDERLPMSLILQEYYTNDDDMARMCEEADVVVEGVEEIIAFMNTWAARGAVMDTHLDVFTNFLRAFNGETPQPSNPARAFNELTAAMQDRLPQGEIQDAFTALRAAIQLKLAQCHARNPQDAEQEETMVRLKKTEAELQQTKTELQQARAALVSEQAKLKQIQSTMSNSSSGSNTAAVGTATVDRPPAAAASSGPKKAAAKGVTAAKGGTSAAAASTDLNEEYEGGYTYDSDDEPTSKTGSKRPAANDSRNLNSKKKK